MLISGASKQGDTLIDLACGKAGDLPKWIASKLSFVFGIDDPRIAVKLSAPDWIAADELINANDVTVNDISGYHGTVFVFGDFTTPQPGSNAYVLASGPEGHGIGNSVDLVTKVSRSYK